MNKEKFKALMKRAASKLLTIGTVAVATLTLAACDKDKNVQVPDKNPGGEQQNPSEVEVQTTIGEVLAQYKVDEPNILDVAKTYLMENEELISAKLNDFGDLEMIFKDNNLIFSRIADFSTDMTALLDSDWKNYVLNKLKIASLDEVVSGQDKVDSLTEKVEAAIASYKAEVKALSNAKTTRNDFGGGNFDDKGALKNVVSDDLLVYKYNSARKDDSFVIIGVDKQGNVIEYLVQMNELGTGDVYKRFTNGIEGVDYTIQRTTLDISKPYKQPAEREIVSFDDLYTSVFGKDFVFKPYKEVLEELIGKIMPREKVKILTTGIVDSKFRVYFENYDSAKRRNLSFIEYQGKENVVDDVNYLAEMTNYSDIKDFFNDYKDKKFIKDSDVDNQTQEYLLSVKNNIITKQNNIEKLKIDDWFGRNQLTGTKEELDFEKFGEQYLKVTGKTDAKLIAAYVGAMTPHRINPGLFDVDYTSYFDLSVLYKENNSIKIYKAQVAVPWYTNSTDETLYNSFINNKAFKFGSETTEIIDNANLLTELTNNNEKEIYLKDFEQEIYIEDDKRLA